MAGTSFADPIWGAVNTPIDFTITPSTPNIYFAFNVEEGKRYNFFTESTNSAHDLYGYLYDSNQNKLDEDDDDGPGYHPSIPFTATYTGVVYTMVRSYYTGVTVNATAKMAEVVPIQGESFDNPIQFTITNLFNATYSESLPITYYKIDGFTPGVEYTIQSISENVDPFASLYDANRNYLKMDDDSGNVRNFLITVTPTTSTLYLELKWYGSPPAGTPYSIKIQESDPTVVTGVSLNEFNLSLKKGRTVQLTATITPSTAINKNVIWSSSNDSIATVNSSGFVTAVGVGQATITVTTVDGGYTATCVIAVREFFGGGDGSTWNPYIVEDHRDLSQVRNNSTSHFKQAADIDLSGLNWIPIPNFSGKYDGNGFVIKNLTINTTEDYEKWGLFGQANNATFEKVQLTNVNFTLGEGHGSYLTVEGVGGLVGNADTCTINNCLVTGNIKASITTMRNNVTGNYSPIIISDVGTYINEMTASTLFRKQQSFGGLAGRITMSTITKSCAMVNIDVKSTFGQEYYTGGFIGMLTGNTKARTTIRDCYAIGSFHHFNKVGKETFSTDYTCYISGFIGGGNYIATDVINCYSIPISVTHRVLATNDSTSRCIFVQSGFNEEVWINYDSCYYENGNDYDLSYSYNKNGSLDSVTTLDYTVNAPEVKKKPKAEMKRQNTFIDWDFINTWKINEGADYPRLIWQKDETKVIQCIAVPFPLRIVKMT